MARLSPLLRKAQLLLVLFVSLYALGLVSLTNSRVQRHVLYSHKVRAWWRDLNKPEQFGFAKNQVTPFNFTTTDGETLYAWHILPIGLYEKYESEVLGQASGLSEDITKTTSFRLLQKDPDAKLVIIFHGNAGDVSQGWRTDSYRTLSYGSTSNIHVLAFDYRGFGFSTGSPTEKGLVQDGIAAVSWATQVAKVPRSRIVLIGESLGTAVSTAVAEYHAKNGIEFAGLVLIAGFTNLPTLLLTYSLAGYIPLLGPLQVYSRIFRLFLSSLLDTWLTTTRLANLVKLSRNLRLFIIHSIDDNEIPWAHSDELFAAAVNATTEGGMDLTLLNKMKARTTVDMGDGAFVSTWSTWNNAIIQEQIVGYGYHSRLITYAPVTLAVSRAFTLDDGVGRQNFHQ